MTIRTLIMQTIISGIATVPNLLALILLRREIKQIDSEYVVKS